MSAAPIRLGLVGAGQIAQVQHLPVLAASGEFRLAAVVDPNPRALSLPDGVALFASQAELVASGLVEAVALCTPPQMRYGLAREAFRAGLHVLLEKPPAQTVSEVMALATLARQTGRTLFTAWHSMFSGAVEPARRLLSERGAAAMRIVWTEDVEKFHPGVDWFWQPGGLGVFDPGINALSIAVACLAEPLFVRAARFRVADGAHTPVSAELDLATPTRQQDFSARFDWAHRGEECWTIDWILADGATLSLAQGGRRLALDGAPLVEAADAEYAALYARFARLIREGRSEVELRPLQLAADAALLARRQDWR